MLKIGRNLGIRAGSISRTRLLTMSNKLMLGSSCLSRRAYSAGSSSSNNEIPGFGKIALVGVIGTYIFYKAAQSIDRNKPKEYVSEDEYNNVMSGLKRRVSIFKPDEVEIHLSPIKDVTKVKRLFRDDKQMIYIDPAKLAEQVRQDPEDPYEPLLEELVKKHGTEAYYDHLPFGMAAMLTGRYMKENCKAGDRIVVYNFPLNIQEAIKFENEISILKDIVVYKDDQSIDGVVSYYKTVKKVQEI
ncbi:hypothetical protein Kpol_1043p12 [Vanderwaltozyma polyspora DSM 70294]|uniref:Altered inheritance of mitochondria protein 36, mitochondrial n=1 Tax=Vanderwaltozyma polyspora (strain ATCC 22028 / DSM 70294 / BCRC 21397 / CBS 2163 / NBRC 10782 / NRRL Y-8283 / UCD 57-17) TaxID=436907 RepID=AIM36_VANPO|nr:uncharacterized protein Kpol_1043p12 [Vanderwaltozyma polyspora DSM 70294]A7TIN0.1 RecName: Full=Altered inheritance of mitochondria protein 36, mitochondrial; AltName: Full=Found in mitochondria protein 39; Flags: Precursor [Vanderwaltozyma polyspora DSM 70294]EDO17822.1 hypothetical protein Kpol_1043p12 [Vanderwaltozyma polyspora DSM 70294]